MSLAIFSFGSGFVEKFNDFFNKIASLSFGISDVFDIIFVAFVIYGGIKIIRGTKAFSIIKGLIVLAIMYLIIVMLNMEVTSYIFRYVFSNIVLLLIIIFQQEIRQLVEKLGRRNINGTARFLFGSSGKQDEIVNNAIVEICKAVKRMSDSKTGALIVMEKNALPSEVLSTGTVVDAEISHELIGTVFYPKSPLHDGAALVREGRLYKAACVLPLTRNDTLATEMGTRHRAALGMSENSDALVVVVSEETGTISVAINGEFTRDLNESDLRAKMIDYMIGDPEKPTEEGLFKKLFKVGSKKKDEE